MSGSRPGAPTPPVPRLVTSRLLLRGWTPEDAGAYAALCADPEVMRHLGGPMDRVASWRQMALFAGHWSLRGYGLWAVERREDGVLIGRTGLWNPEGWPGLELGWTLARHAWGRGYATEAARAAMDWAWSALAAPELISLVAPANRLSARVAERLGMRHERELAWQGATVGIYTIRRPNVRVDTESGT